MVHMQDVMQITILQAALWPLFFWHIVFCCLLLPLQPITCASELQCWHWTLDCLLTLTPLLLLLDCGWHFVLTGCHIITFPELLYTRIPADFLTHPFGVCLLSDNNWRRCVVVHQLATCYWLVLFLISFLAYTSSRSIPVAQHPLILWNRCWYRSGKLL